MSRPNLLVSAVFLAVLLIAPTYMRRGIAAADLSAELLASWNLDSLDSAVAPAALSSEAGRCVGSCPQAQPGLLGQALHFSDAHGLQLAVPQAQALLNGQSFSVALWLQYTLNDACATSGVAVVRYGLADQPPLWNLRCAGANGALQWQLRLPNNSYQTLSSPAPLSRGVWHYVVLRYDVRAARATLSLNTREVASADGLALAAVATTGQLWLGSDAPNALTGLALDELRLYRGLLDSKSEQHGYYLPRVAPSNGCIATRIMPLGDSITRGTGTTPRLGYRQPLYQALTKANYQIDFVGSQSDGSSPTSAFDADHEGRSGWTADQVAANVQQWLADHPTELVLLHIGTNDLTSSSVASTLNDLTNILDKIDQSSQATTVVVAQIINRSTPHAPSEQYNAGVAQLVQQRVAAGDKLLLVNMESVLDYSSDLADNLHPNSAGYAKMATAWRNMLEQLLEPCVVPTPSPTFTSTAIGTQPTETPTAPLVERARWYLPLAAR